MPVVHRVHGAGRIEWGAGAVGGASLIWGWLALERGRAQVSGVALGVEVNQPALGVPFIAVRHVS